MARQCPFFVFWAERDVLLKNAMYPNLNNWCREFISGGDCFLTKQTGYPFLGYFGGQERQERIHHPFTGKAGRLRTGWRGSVYSIKYYRKRRNLSSVFLKTTILT
jgi:hypothetical protein